MNAPTSDRAGQYVKQPQGFGAFVPKPLPPDPPLRLNQESISLLSQADIALGRLDGAAEVLPNPDLFVAMYVRKEAVLSSQIEGTQASLIDVVEYEAEGGRQALRRDTAEVVNYVDAMNYGLRRLRSFPLCLRLIRELHQRLLAGERGGEREPGEFRRSQNWIGPPGGSLNDATFVPPPVHEMKEGLAALEAFLHESPPFPSLVQCALVHAQFETIHPFVDGNGRVGRLLITFLLCQQEVLRRPLLYLSYYLKKNRTEYYDRLMAVRTEGDWEGWLRFFLRGVAQVAEQATETARRILAMQAEHRDVLGVEVTSKGAALRLLDELYTSPVVSVKQVSKMCDVTYPTANTLVSQMVQLGLLREITGTTYGRLFAYAPYLDILREGTEPDSA